jgi:protein involved in polysaccharide export with SLBB domain
VLEGKKSLWMQPGDIVSVMEADVVYVVGNVVEPRPVELKKEISLTQAIAAARGMKPNTKKSAVRILRKKADSIEREVIVCDLGEIEKGKATDPILKPDDIVAVSDDPVKIVMKSVISALTNSIGLLPYYLRF